MNLHLIQRNPFSHGVFDECLKLVQNNDSILLMGDGVYSLKHPILSTIEQPIYALEADCLGRGLETQLDGITFIDMARFVKLCSQHKQTLSWF